MIMPCGITPGVFRCGACGTEFEPDVADGGPNGEPRCPQCGLLEAAALDEYEEFDYLIRTSTPFR